jgi:uncharacterized membrane protein
MDGKSLDRVAPRRSSRVKIALRWLLTVVMVAAGTFHFVNPEIYLRIMPPYLPWHEELVLLSGVFEILGGLGLAVAPLRAAAGWGLVTLLIAVFPANLHMAIHGISFGSEPAAPGVLWARLPLQLVFIAWAWWVSRPDASEALVAEAEEKKA